MATSANDSRLRGDHVPLVKFHKSIKVQGSLKPLKSSIGCVLLSSPELEGTASLYFVSFSNISFHMGVNTFYWKNCKGKKN